MEHASGCARSTFTAPSLALVSGEVPRCRSVAAYPHEAPLACLEALVLSRRYHAWWGLSGVRYTTSIFPVDRAADDGGLPSFDGFVLMSVARSGGTSRLIAAVAVETDADRSAAIASGVDRQASEWHVHLLAEDPWRRRAAVDDLLARHRPEVMAVLSA